jgi:hypothetical protein
VVDEVETVAVTGDSDCFDLPVRRQSIHDLVHYLGHGVPDDSSIALIMARCGMKHWDSFAARDCDAAVQVERGCLDVGAADVKADEIGVAHYASPLGP